MHACKTFHHHTYLIIIIIIIILTFSKTIIDFFIQLWPEYVNFVAMLLLHTSSSAFGFKSIVHVQ